MTMRYDTATYVRTHESMECVVLTITPARNGTNPLSDALHNLVKGAAGQALQNANLMLGLAEGEGLPS